jgi:prepilin-type N-terminal cleavage/methylation domain-containing protein
MRFPPTNPPAGLDSRLAVEWHDCRWSPAIQSRPAVVTCREARIKPLIPAAFLPHPARRKNLFKLMKKHPAAARRFRSGFTLVELLVVIAIIAILAAMLLPVLTAVKKKALVAKARTEIGQIVTAINAYDQDYSRFPVTPDEQTAAGANDFTCGLIQYPQNNTLSWPPGAAGNYAFDSNSNVVAVLMDLETYANGTRTANFQHVKNPKQVKFLNAKASGYDPATGQQNPQGGVDNNGIYRDPWGNPYIITMDTSYDDQASDLFYCQQKVSQQNLQTGYNGLLNTTDPSGNGDHFLFHGKVMVWSAGPDGQIDRTIPFNQGVNKDNVLSWQ